MKQNIKSFFEKLKDFSKKLCQVFEEIFWRILKNILILHTLKEQPQNQIQATFPPMRFPHHTYNWITRKVSSCKFSAKIIHQTINFRNFSLGEHSANASNDIINRYNFATLSLLL